MNNQLKNLIDKDLNKTNLSLVNAFLEKCPTLSLVEGKFLNIIQLGTNNGNDHVFDFISKNERKIKNFLAIDALPRCVELVKERYSFLEERLIPLNVAIGIKDGYAEFFYPKKESESYLSSLIELQMLVRSELKLLNKMIVPVFNINTLFNNLSFNKIDRLYIDIEGMDGKVLVEMDFEKFLPDFIQFEYSHSSGTDLEKIFDKFRKYKYSINQAPRDVYATRIT